MLEWYWGLLIAGLIASVGGLLHVIVPPFATDWRSVLQRYVAAWIVGIILGLSVLAIEPTIFDKISGYLVIVIGFLLVSGYTAIDIIKQILEGGGVPPVPPPMKVRVPKNDPDIEAALDNNK